MTQPKLDVRCAGCNQSLKENLGDDQMGHGHIRYFEPCAECIAAALRSLSGQQTPVEEAKKEEVKSAK